MVMPGGTRPSERRPEHPAVVGEEVSPYAGSGMMRVLWATDEGPPMTGVHRNGLPSVTEVTRTPSSMRFIEETASRCRSSPAYQRGGRRYDSSAVGGVGAPADLGPAPRPSPRPDAASLRRLYVEEG
jgi:hypothetical protein